MSNTKEWAAGLGVETSATVPPVEDHQGPYFYTARQVATRAIILHGVVAVAAGVDPDPVIHWYRDQGVWDWVSPQERRYLLDPASANEEQRKRFYAHVEAEWALLWVVGKVDVLGLPTCECDTAQLVDELIPALGDDLTEFLETATLRPPGEFLAEDIRTYDLWCYANLAYGKGEPLPDDLHWGVLYQRRYAFEWLDDFQAWDEVTCDA